MSAVEANMKSFAGNRYDWKSVSSNHLADIKFRAVLGIKKSSRQYLDC